MFQQKIKSKKAKDAWAARTVDYLKTHTYEPKTNALPAPVHCNAAVCRPWTKPTCKTMIQPQYNPSQSLKKALVGRC
jgi:hypothetical protein